MSTRARKIAKLASKEYRDAFVGSQINASLPFQIRALREQRNWKQSDLAERAGMLQPRISAMERPGAAKFNLETLRRIASALDIALLVKFVPFSDLVHWSEDFDPDSFGVASFPDDAGLIERKEPESTLDIGQWIAEKHAQGDSSWAVIPTVITSSLTTRLCPDRSAGAHMDIPLPEQVGTQGQVDIIADYQSSAQNEDSQGDSYVRRRA